jgi:AcrR family transcriptional regulator
VVRQAVVPNIAFSEALVGESDEPAPVVLEQLIARLSAAMVAPASAIPKIVIAEAGNFPDIARFYLDEVIHRGLGVFRRLLEQGVARGEFRAMDVDSTAYCIVAPIVLGMLWRHSFARHEKRPLDAGALGRAHMMALTHGLVAVRKSGRAAGNGPRRRRNGEDR